MTSDDDRVLIAGIRDGSEHAFNMLVNRHQHAVRTFLRRVLGSDADADDIAQDTFLAAWTHARSFRDEANVRTWLCGIAWRKAKAAQRSWFRRRTRDAAYNEGLSAANTGGAGMEDRVAVRKALLALPLQQRAAVTLCLVCGFSHSEAAAIIGAPVGTIKSHVLRLEVVARLEQRRFRRRVLLTMAVAVVAVVLVVVNAQAINAWMAPDVRRLWIVALVAAATMFPLPGLRIEILPGAKLVVRAVRRWLYP